MSSYLSHMIADECWHLHRSDCRSTLIYAHTTSRNLPACDVSVSSLTVPRPESGVLVELILLCQRCSDSHDSGV